MDFDCDGLEGLRCFRCRRLGHFANECDAAFGSGPKLATKPQRVNPYVVGKAKPAAYTVGKHKSGPFVLGAIHSNAMAGVSGLPDKGVYVLEDEESGRVYVGKSLNIPERISQHEAGEGAKCAKGLTKRVPTLTPYSSDFESWERAETLTHMHQRGVDKVRGWLYTQPRLSEELRQHAHQQICEKFDLCRKCGHGGHFVADCTRSGSKAVRAAWLSL